MGDSSKLKVSVWSAFVPDRTLAMFVTDKGRRQDARTGMRDVHYEASGLHKEVYAWRLIEDPFGGVVDAGRREALRSRLQDAFDMGVPREGRSIASLLAFVNEARIMLDAGDAEWSGSESAGQDDEERRLNPLLAFANHLSWLAAVFDEQPNVSVTVR